LWVWASPAYAGTQLVTITAIVRGCLGSNTTYACWPQGQKTLSWYIAPGAWRPLDPKGLGVAFGTQSGAGYFMQLAVTWQTPSGYTLGRERISYRSRGDGGCYTAHCQFWGPSYYNWTYTLG